MNLWSFKNRIYTISIRRYEPDNNTKFCWGYISLFQNTDELSLEECAWKVVERIAEISESYVFEYDTLQIAEQRALAITSYTIHGDAELNPEYIRFINPYVLQHNGIVYVLEFPEISIGLRDMTPFEVSIDIVDEMIESFYVE